MPPKRANPAVQLQPTTKRDPIAVRKHRYEFIELAFNSVVLTALPVYSALLLLAASRIPWEGHPNVTMQAGDIVPVFLLAFCTSAGLSLLSGGVIAIWLFLLRFRLIVPSILAGFVGAMLALPAMTGTHSLLKAYQDWIVPAVLASSAISALALTTVAVAMQNAAPNVSRRLRIAMRLAALLVAANVAHRWAEPLVAWEGSRYPTVALSVIILILGFPLVTWHVTRTRTSSWTRHDREYRLRFTGLMMVVVLGMPSLLGITRLPVFASAHQLFAWHSRGAYAFIAGPETVASEWLKVSSFISKKTELRG